jgi:hypothetical protein
LPWPELYGALRNAGRRKFRRPRHPCWQNPPGHCTFIGIERDNQKTLTYAADEKAWLLNANTPVSPLSDFHFIFLCLHSLA